MLRRLGSSRFSQVQRWGVERLSEANLVELGIRRFVPFFFGGGNGTCNMMMQKTDGCYGVLENSQFISVCVFKCCCFSSAWDTEQDRTMQDVK